MKDLLSPDKRRESKTQNQGWVRPATIRTAVQLLRLIDLAIRVFGRLF